MPIIDLLLLLCAVLVLSSVGTKSIIFLMKRRSIVQQVNHRSLHKNPTPVGGGWAILLAALPIWLLLFGVFDEKHAVLVLSVAGLAIISWQDDMHTLSALSRFGMQFLAVASCLYYIPADQNILHDDLPVVVDRVLSGLCWLWFVNLFNFMDGMDGLAGTETICIALGVVLIGLYINLASTHISLALILAAAAAGFLVWNWSPAKVFLGDVGSIPIGFLLGWLLIQLALNGALLAALILPLYFLFDASFTLAKRLLRGERIWQAHREHLYQKAALAGLTHNQVVLRILPFNFMLIGSAFVSLFEPLLAIGLAGFALLGIVLVLSPPLILLLRQNAPEKTALKRTPITS